MRLQIIYNYIVFKVTWSEDVCVSDHEYEPTYRIVCFYNWRWNLVHIIKLQTEYTNINKDQFIAIFYALPF